MDWTDNKKAFVWSLKADNKLPQNVQDIRRNHKLYRENYENLESGIASWSEDLETYIPGRCTITAYICNSDDAT